MTTYHTIDKFHHATIEATNGGWRVYVYQTGGSKPVLRNTTPFPSLQAAEEYVSLCKEHGVDSAGVCCLYTQRAYATGRRWVKPEFQR